MDAEPVFPLATDKEEVKPASLPERQAALTAIPTSK